MPEDDGSQVNIDSQTVLRYSDGTYAHIVKVCNKTSSAKDTWVTTWPYGAGGKLGDKKGKRLEVPANSCRTVRFSLREKPTQYYTDVYDYGNRCCPEGDRYHYIVNAIGKGGYVDVQLPPPIENHFPRRMSTRHCHMPYPRSLEEPGRFRTFRLQRYRGLPNGWSVGHSWPGVGDSVRLAPHEKECPFSVQFHAEVPPPEGVTVVMADISIDDRPIEPPYSVPLEFRIIRKTDLPRLHGITAYREDRKPRIGIIAYTSDDLGLLAEPEIRYSIDGGETWKRRPMDPFHLGRMGEHGLIGGLFRTVIGVESDESTVLVSVIARDQLGNERASAVRAYPSGGFDGSAVKGWSKLTDFEKAVAEQVLVAARPPDSGAGEWAASELDPATSDDMKEDIPRRYHRLFDAVAQAAGWPGTGEENER